MNIAHRLLHTAAAGIFVIALPALVHAQSDNEELLDEIMEEQDFLARKLPGKGYNAGIIRTSLRKYTEASGLSGNITGPATIVSVAPVRPCVSTFTYQYGNDVMFETWGPNTPKQRAPLVSMIPLTRGILGDTIGTNWRDLVSVTRGPTTISLRFGPQEHPGVIFLRDKDDANAVMDAIEFLRDQCKKLPSA